MPNTAYFKLQVNVFPDFLQYYTWSGWPNSGGAGSCARAIADINGDGKDDVILDMWQGQSAATAGTVTNGPTPNRVLVFLSQSDGTYKDATASLLPNNPLGILPGEARNISVGDANEDGRPDFAFSLSREDGRSGDPWSNSIAQSVVMVSQPDGTYKLMDVGNPDWSQTIGIIQSNGVGHIFFNGFTNANATQDYWNSTQNMVTVSGVDLVLNPAGTAWVMNGPLPIDGSGFVALPPDKAGGLTQYIVTVSRDASNSTYPTLAVLGTDGKWAVTDIVRPFEFRSVPFVSWQGMLKTGSVAIINGTVLTGITYDDYQQFTPYPGAAPVAVLRISSAAIEKPQSDGAYHETDGTPYCALQFYAVQDNKLVVAPIRLIDEQHWINNNFEDFLDINKDGLQDIVEYPYTESGAPIVYLNTGAGQFVHIDASSFPTAPPEWTGNPQYAPSTSKFLDVNGDGYYDLMYWSSNGISNGQENNATPRVYLGQKNLLTLGDGYLNSITVDDRIGSPLIHTFAGNDTIHDTGASSKTLINAGDGRDVAIYSAVAKDYQLTLSAASGCEIKLMVGQAGVPQVEDTLLNVETLKFADKSVIIESQSHASYANLPVGLYQFFITAFNAAPGVTYMDQLAAAYGAGMSLKQIVDVFTTKTQFTDVYPTSLSHSQLAQALVSNIVKTSASDATKQAAVKDITDAMDNAKWTVGQVIYQVFGNLANFAYTDPSWGNTAKQFANEIAVAKAYTDTLSQSTTDLATLRSVMAPVSHQSDVSTPELQISLIGQALLAG
jgi:hypothetical protein